MSRVPGEPLNHHHLYHFWTEVGEGGVTRLPLLLGEWFQKQRGRLGVVDAFQDSALLDAFGQAGTGLSGCRRRSRRRRGVGPGSARAEAQLGSAALLSDHRREETPDPAVIAISGRARALLS